MAVDGGRERVSEELEERDRLGPALGRERLYLLNERAELALQRLLHAQVDELLSLSDLDAKRQQKRVDGRVVVRNLRLI